MANLNDARKLTIPVTFHITHDLKSGLTLKHAEIPKTKLAIRQSPTHPIQGTVTSVLGGGVEIDYGGYKYYTHPMDLWKGLLAVLNKDPGIMADITAASNPELLVPGAVKPDTKAAETFNPATTPIVDAGKKGLEGLPKVGGEK